MTSEQRASLAQKIVETLHDKKMLNVEEWSEARERGVTAVDYDAELWAEIDDIEKTVLSVLSAELKTTKPEISGKEPLIVSIEGSRTSRNWLGGDGS